MEEIWKDINGYEGLYQISNLGNIRSYIRNRNKNLKYNKTKDNYQRITLTKEKTKKSYLVHRLVAQAFVPNPLLKKQVNHKDFDVCNNRADNLEWVTARENVIHSYNYSKKAN